MSGFCWPKTSESDSTCRMSKTFRAWKIDEPLFLPPMVGDFVAKEMCIRDRPQHPQHRVPEGIRRTRLHRAPHRWAAALHFRRGAVPGGLKPQPSPRPDRSRVYPTSAHKEGSKSATAVSIAERGKRVNPAGTRSKRTSRSSAPSRRSRSRRGCRDRRPSPR